jgi:hypothetical protein
MVGRLGLEDSLLAGNRREKRQPFCVEGGVFCESSLEVGVTFPYDLSVPIRRLHHVPVEPRRRRVSRKMHRLPLESPESMSSPAAVFFVS